MRYPRTGCQPAVRRGRKGDLCLRSGGYVSIETALRRYANVESAQSLETFLGQEVWRGLVGPAKTWHAAYLAGDTLGAIGVALFGLAIGLLAANIGVLDVAIALTGFVMVLPWVWFARSRQSLDRGELLRRATGAAERPCRLFLRFHLLTMTGRIVVYEPSGVAWRRGRVRPVETTLFESDHGWLALLGSERGHLRVKANRLRHLGRELFVDWSAIEADAGLAGELLLLRAHHDPSSLVDLDRPQTDALRERLHQLGGLDSKMLEAFEVLERYRAAYRERPQKEYALQSAAVTRAEQLRQAGLKFDATNASRERQIIDGKNEAVHRRLHAAVDKLLKMDD